jgi:hypothetical protein
LNTWVQNEWWRLSAFYRRDLLVAPRKLVDGAKLLSDRCVTITYEDLVREPADSVEKICRFLRLDYSETLLEYGSRVDRKWTLGDPTGAHQHNLPHTESLHSWRTGFRTNQSRHLALSYIAELGASTIQEMGYCVKDMTSIIKPPEAEKGLIPWSELMKERETILDEIELDLYRYPEHLGEILHRYVMLHHRGLLGLVSTKGVLVARRLFRLFSNRTRHDDFHA